MYPSRGVDGGAAGTHLEVKVRARRDSGLSHSGNRLPGEDLLPRMDVQGGAVGVARLQSVAVVEDHEIAVGRVMARLHDSAGTCGADGGSLRSRQVDAVVVLQGSVNGVGPHAERAADAPIVDERAMWMNRRGRGRARPRAAEQTSHSQPVVVGELAHQCIGDQ